MIINGTSAGGRESKIMSGAALMNYLYSHSRWIEDYFTFAKEPSGALPEIRIGDWSRFFAEKKFSSSTINYRQCTPE